VVKVRLDGVIVARDPAASIALLRVAGDARARVLRIGEEHAGFVLVEVSRDSVLLSGAAGETRLYLSPERELEASEPSASPEERRAALERDRWERRRFPKETSRARLDKEMPVILSDTELEPEVANGEVLGLRLARLPDGTLLSETGLLPGDVLLSLNGEPLVDLDALWETLAHLDGEDELRLVVQRRGRTLRLAYDLVD
jgi:type II secretion system protein C